MIKILADECIHTDLIGALRKAGWDVLTVSEANLIGKSDEDIFKTAILRKRVILTFDRGFGDIFRFNISASPGIVIVLIGQMTRGELIDIPLAFLSSLGEKSLAGKLVIIGKRRIRISER